MPGPHPRFAGGQQFTLLHQRIGELTEEKLGLQRGLVKQQRVAEGLVEENQTLAAQYNAQARVVDGLNKKVCVWGSGQGCEARYGGGEARHVSQRSALSFRVTHMRGACRIPCGPPAHSFPFRLTLRSSSTLLALRPTLLPPSFRSSSTLLALSLTLLPPPSDPAVPF